MNSIMKDKGIKKRKIWVTPQVKILKVEDTESGPFQTTEGSSGDLS